MSNELIIALSGIVAGSVFTGIASYITFCLRDNRDLKKKKEFFTKAIIDDLKRSDDLYDRILCDWDKTKSVPFEHTIELKESRRLYQNHEDHVLQFSDKLRGQLFKYYVKSSKLINLLEIQQGRVLNLELEYQKLLQKLRLAFPEKKDKEMIAQMALTIMATEDKEVMNIRQSIQKEMDELKDHKREAVAIIDKLESKQS